MILCMGISSLALSLPKIANAQESRNAKQNQILSAIENLLEQGENAPDDQTFVKAPVIQGSVDPEDLVLAVTVNRRVISSGIFAIQQNGQYYLPVAGLSDVVGFYYDIDTPKRYVEGYTFSEKDSYRIDANNNSVIYKGDRINVSPEAFVDADFAGDDVYVRQDVLEQIWPMRFDVNLSSLVLNIIPDNKLPFQLAFDRKLERERSMRNKSEDELEDFPFIPYPYQLITKPVVDVSALFGFDEDTDEYVSSVNVNGANDLGYASADYSANFAQRGDEFQRPRNIRFRLTRQNIHEGALPFGLEEAQAGDVRLRNRELISPNTGGRGFVFSTEDRQKLGDFDRITIDGVGTPGYEVELYLNGELLVFSEVDERGEYRFEDVSVGYGNNRFRVVLYGPQGQIEERVENYIYQASMIKKGETDFYGGIVDANKALIPIDDINRRGLGEGLSANLYGSYGVAEKLTAFATASRSVDRAGGQDIEQDFVSVGAVGSLGSTLAQVEGYKDLDGGTAIDVRTISDFYGFKLNTQVSSFQDFESTEADRDGAAKTLETEISVRKIFRTLVGALGLELRQRYLRRETGPTTTEYTTRQSFGVGGVSFTNTTETDLIDGEHSFTTGRINSSSRHKAWNWRNALSYNIHPTSEVTALQTDLLYGDPRDYRLGLSAAYNLIQDETRLGAQISRDFKKYLGSLETEWSSRNGFGFTLRASTALGPYAKDGGYTYRSNSYAGVGPISANIYNDNNLNDIFDDGDDPVQEARIRLDRRSSRDLTDEDGYVMDVTTANVGRVNVKVLEESIEDPYLVSSTPGYSVYPRVGVVQRLEFPLIETGAIDGTLRQSLGGQPIAGVTLQILDEEGDVIQETRTAADGYYTFEKIPPGSYTIRPDPEDGLQMPSKTVNLTKDNLFLFGTDVLASRDDVPDFVDIDTRVQDDGTMSAKGILALAKGFKEKGRVKGFKKKAQNTATLVNAVEPNAGGAKPVIRDIRVGKHSNKVRMVMDLSAPIQYSINFDPQSSTVYVDVPYADISADNSWQDQNSAILNNYRVEKMEQGIRLILGVANDVKVGTSGLLKASAGKQDRLYIDIEKK